MLYQSYFRILAAALLPFTSLTAPLDGLTLSTAGKGSAHHERSHQVWDCYFSMFIEHKCDRHGTYYHYLQIEKLYNEHGVSKELKRRFGIGTKPESYTVNGLDLQIFYNMPGPDAPVTFRYGDCQWNTSTPSTDACGSCYMEYVPQANGCEEQKDPRSWFRVSVI